MSWPAIVLDEPAPAHLEQLRHAARDDGEVLAPLRRVPGQRAAVEDPVRIRAEQRRERLRRSCRSTRWTLTIGESSSAGAVAEQARALERRHGDDDRRRHRDRRATSPARREHDRPGRRARARPRRRASRRAARSGGRVASRAAEQRRADGEEPRVRVDLSLRRLSAGRTKMSQKQLMDLSLSPSRRSSCSEGLSRTRLRGAQSQGVKKRPSPQSHKRQVAVSQN